MLDAERSQPCNGRGKSHRPDICLPTLNVDSLRAYLKRLPGFEDFEAERKAFEIAAKHRSTDTALEFFVAWPNLQRADEIVRVREKELDGGAHYKLRPAAEAHEVDMRGVVIVERPSRSL